MKVTIDGVVWNVFQYNGKTFGFMKNEDDSYKCGRLKVMLSGVDLTPDKVREIMNNHDKTINDCEEEKAELAELVKKLEEDSGIKD